MKIIVCIKQVPDSAKVEVDEENGTLKRMGTGSKINPYDLYALETALRIREVQGGTVTALTMGPKQAEAMMRDVYMMGVDEAVILSDQKFAGSDVLATSHTLVQGIKTIDGADLIICGKQTTDGDTAQIGPAIAEHMAIPHVAWVKSIENISDQSISVLHKIGHNIQESKMHYPCLITVEKGINVPRLPSYRLGLDTKDRPIRFISFEELPTKNLSRFGLVGSPTKVDQMFQPKVALKQVYIEGDHKEKTDKLFHVLAEMKLV